MKPRIVFLLILILVAGCLIVGGIAYRNITTTTSPPPPNDNYLADALPPSNSDDGPHPEITQEASLEDKQRRVLRGVWQDEYKGKRPSPPVKRQNRGSL